MKRVLVTDGEQRAALALVRSLGRRGDQVIVGSRSGDSLAGTSRWARRDVRLPDAATESEAYGGAVEKLVADERVDVLIPVTELALRTLLPRRSRVSAVIPFPDLEAFCRISDKAWLADRATTLGVPTPRQLRVDDPGALAGREAEIADIAFPLVLKPSRSVVRTRDGARSVGVGYASDLDELRDTLARIPCDAYPVLLQQRIVGPGQGLFLLLWDGEVRAVFGHRRIREVPPTGGVSVCRESVPVDPRLLELSLRLLRDVGWQGVAMVEFKIDATTGVPHLLEINGRFWGSLQLAVDAGVDFPALLLDALEGTPRPPRPVTNRRHVRTRWLWGEVDWLIAMMRGRGSVRAAGAPNAPRRLRALGGVLRWTRHDRTEVLRWSDPAPFLAESVGWVREVLGARRW